MDTPLVDDHQQKPSKEGGKKQISLERMRVALEKLQLARIKATFTFIGIGFASYKFFYARIDNGKTPLLDFPNGWHIGLFMIFTGLVTLLFSTIQHYKSSTRLKAQYESMHYSISLLLSYLVIILSIILLVAVIFEF